jgi:putative cell wall-binding protein
MPSRRRPRCVRIVAVAAVLLSGLGAVGLSPEPARANGAPAFTLDVVSAACPDTLYWQPRLVSQPGVSWRGAFTLTLKGDSGTHGPVETLSKSERGYDTFSSFPSAIDGRFTSVDWEALGTNPRIEVTWTYGLNDDLGTTANGLTFSVPVVPWTTATLTTGTGSAADPFRVSTPAQVSEMRCHAGVSTYFAITSDIDLGGIPNFLPLASSGTMHGVIDGGGHTISNLTVDFPQSSRVGFIAKADSLLMRDVTFANATVSARGEAGVVFGMADDYVVLRDITVTNGLVHAYDTGGLLAGELEKFTLVRPTVDGEVRITPLPYVGANARPGDATRAKDQSYRMGGLLGKALEGSVTDAVVDLRLTGEAYELRYTGGLIGYPDEQLLISGLDADIVMDVVTTLAQYGEVGGVLGEYGLDEGSFLVDSDVRLSMTLTAPTTSDDVKFLRIGGISGNPEEGGVHRTAITGSLTLDVTQATGNVTVEYIGGAFGRVTGYNPSITETFVGVDVTILGDARSCAGNPCTVIPVTDVGALAGSTQQVQFSDVRVDGSVSISGAAERVGGLIGHAYHPWSPNPRNVLDSVIYRGSVSVVTSSAVGTLFGDPAVSALVSNTWWDSSINGLTAPDRGLPGSAATSAQLGDLAWLTSRGFSPRVWCVVDGVPVIATLSRSTCRSAPSGGSGSGGAASAAPVVVERERVGGRDRFATAASLSQRFFQPGVSVVYLATGAQFADALVLGPLARGNAPVLLLRRDEIPESTLAELLRLRPRSIVVLGGPSVVSDAVLAALDEWTTGSVTRLFGADRYSTATAVSQISHPGRASVVYVATGSDFADALGGSPYATLGGGPIFLVQHDSIPSSVATELERLQPNRIVVLGGPQAVSAGVVRQLRGFTTGSVTRLHGSDRYGTSVAISQAGFAPGVDIVFLATGRDFADALPAAAISGNKGPVLLVRHDCVPVEVYHEVVRLQAKEIIVLGDTAAVSASAAALRKCSE